jgi:stearoyl-CoA desaturase (delta-9 desaturase)
VAGRWGNGLGHHRLLTHRGYKTPKWVEYFLTWCGTLALEGGPMFWVATHRVHHQKSDREGDPHTPREGGFWSHMGWILLGKGLHQEASLLQRYVPDLARDPKQVWLSKWHWTSNVIVGLLLLAFGGWTYVLWGIFFRTTFGLHCTWLVNSATHMWGGRRFTTRDDSTNNWWVALLTFGEGWHNNHHAHPTSARHGLAWYEFDFNWIGISTLTALGLAWDVKVAKIAQPVPYEENDQPVVAEEAVA